MERETLLLRFINDKKPFIAKWKSKERLFCPSSEIFNYRTLSWCLSKLDEQEPVITLIPFECGAEDVTHCPLYSPVVAVQKCMDGKEQSDEQ